MKRLIASMTATLCLACQTYSVVPYASVRSGNNVRVTVTNAGSLAVLPLVGRDVEAVEGRVTSVDTSGVTLLVESVNRGTDIMERVDASTLRLTMSEISAAELRRIDKPKTFLVASLLTAAVLLIAQGSTNGGFLGLGHGGSGGSR